MDYYLLFIVLLFGIFIYFVIKCMDAIVGAIVGAVWQRRTANLEHLTNFHYYDHEDRYYNYAQRQWILK